MSKQKQFSFKSLHYSVLLMLLALVISACNIGNPTTPENPGNKPQKSWKTSEMADSALLNSNEIALAISPTGEPALAYSINTDNLSNIIYRVRENGSWSVENVFSKGSSRGNKTTLAFNNAGQPLVGHGAFHPVVGMPTAALSTPVDGKWVSETMGMSMYGVAAPDLVCDSQGRIHSLTFYYPNKISHVSTSYILRDSNDKVLESYNASARDIDIAVDSLDNATYIYKLVAENYDAPTPTYHATYKSIENGKPVEELIKAVPTGYMTISLAIDSKDMRAISYYNNKEKTLHFAKRVNGQWLVETVESAGSTYGNCSLTFDSSDRAVIAFYDKTESSLKVARQSAAGWDIETVDNSGDVGSACTIKAGEKGYLAIAYVDDVRKKVKLAEYR